MSAQTEPERTDIAVELAQLSDLFRRRLLEDRTMRLLLEQQQARIAQLEDEVTGHRLIPLLQNLRLVIDRARAHSDGSGFGASIADELIAAIADLGIEPIDDLGPLDLSIHDVIGTEPGDTRTVIRVTSVGFRKGGRTLIPARVVVGAVTAES